MADPAAGPAIRPLKAVDRALEDARTLSSADEPVRLQRLPMELAEAILTCIAIPQRDWRGDPAGAIFDQSLPSPAKKLVAACLVRLWACCPDVFSQNVIFRNHSTTLFDLVFGPEIYGRLKVREKSQTHEKSAALIDALRDSEDGIRSAAALLQGIQSAQFFEKAFFTIYNKVPATYLIAPFLPKHEFHAKLHGVTARVETYSNASPSEVVDAYESALSYINERIAEAHNLGTKYSEEFLCVPLARLRDSLVGSFQSSPLKQDAEFRITRSDKKYPFHSVRLPINLEIEVENAGPGYASDVEISIKDLSEGRLTRTTYQIGDMPPSKRMLPVEVILEEPTKEVLAEIELSWLTFDRKQEALTTTLEFTAQKAGIDWAALSTAEPYDVEPISDDSQLIGRTEILQQLIGMATATSLGSAIVHGQKRVGKTSIVKALQSKLVKADPSLFTAYVLVGEYVRPDAIRSIQGLGIRLCEEIRDSDFEFSDLPIPVFDDALAPLGDFIRAAQRRKPKRFLFILDEFDELPIELYSQNEIANSFFLGLRSLSARPEIGFVLVGSERMSAILSFQGQSLNKFKSIKVDYFDRQAHWTDFINLVRQPAQHYLEFSDRAVELIYSYTAGNPYFTKLICKSIVKIMVNRRDAHVTDSEVYEACTTELRNIDINSFVHFWEDGIVEIGPDRERVFLTRRKVLLAFGEVLRRTGTRATVPQVQLAVRDYEVNGELAKEEMDEFVQRKVFERTGEMYSIKVRFFSEWLREFGVSQILSRLAGRIAAIERRAAEIAYVRGEEIFDFVKQVNIYKGRPLTPDQIRDWLSQFGADVNQRLMFKILSAVRYFSEFEIRTKLGDLHSIISKEIGLPAKHGTGRVEHLAVSYLEGPGKSGYQYARLYSEENKIIARNVVDLPKLANVFLQSNVRAVLWVDDFIGTGRTILTQFEENRDELARLQKQYSLRYFVGALAGLQESQAMIEDALSKQGIRVSVRICEPLSAKDQCFSPDSRFFESDEERLRAKRIAEDNGRRIVPRHPLGFGDCGTCVVFERSCPNNNLPVLWGNANDWKPIFPR
jgi:hypothetical protein